MYYGAAAVASPASDRSVTNLPYVCMELGELIRHTLGRSQGSAALGILILIHFGISCPSLSHWISLEGWLRIPKLWFLRSQFSPRLSTIVNPHLSREQVHVKGRILTNTHLVCVKDKSKSKTKLIKPVHKLAARKSFSHHLCFSRGSKMLGSTEILTGSLENILLG